MHGTRGTQTQCGQLRVAVKREDAPKRAARAADRDRGLDGVEFAGRCETSIEDEQQAAIAVTCFASAQ